MKTKLTMKCILMCLLFGCIAGCQPESAALSDKTEPDVTSEESKTPAVNITNEESVKLEVTDWAGIQQLVKKSAGKVVLINIWTTTCGNCVEEFPWFVALQDKYDRDKFMCISVNCDYDGIEGKPPEFYRERVVEFLAKQAVQCAHVMLNVSFLEYLDQQKLESTPALYLYDDQGLLVKRFDNDESTSSATDFTHSDVSQQIDRLIH